MRRSMCVAMAMAAACAAGCVKVDLGQASKDWANVGKGFADAYKAQGVGTAVPQQAPATAPPMQ